MKINRMVVWIGIAILLVLFASSCQPCPTCDEPTPCPECKACPESTECPECTECPERDECPPCECDCCSGCIDFKGFQLDTNFLDKFQLDGLGFESIDGSDLYVWEVDGVISLHLPTAGIRISLPCPASEVTITVGSWVSGTFFVEAYDSGNNLVDQMSVPGDNSFHTVTLSGKDVATVIISDVGDNEGALAEICIVFE